MHKLYVFAFFIIATLVSLLIVQPAQAISNNLVISQVQIGSETSATDEFIEIYNGSSSDIEITNWCLYYASASSSLFGSKMACFLPQNNSVHLFLPAYSTVFAISNELSAKIPELKSDIKFSATLSGSGGHVRLLNSSGVGIDKVGWGTAVSAEGAKPAIVPLSGQILSRKIIDASILQDTDINGDDFESVIPKEKYTYGSIYEVVDICTNIDGIQVKTPDGYNVDALGNCYLTVVDVCINIEGTQQITPLGYKIIDDKCMLDLLPLRITELLPNTIASDDGNEFIEIFNPNASDIYLTNYILYISSSGTKYGFPVGSHIDAGQYLAFSNDDIKFTLINTISGVSLYSIDNQLIDETPNYENPNEGEAWAKINENWQYTNRPTLSGENMVSLIHTEETILPYSELEPCATNQYRSPETNRCRLIVSSSSTLAPCKDGQYRSEETNRCRSIALDVSSLTPCAEGQERNPATNRCRSITSVLGANDLVPCKEGQERNPETNRCRNIVSAIPLADYAPEQKSENVNNIILWWSLAAVGGVATIYGIWEWRQEIINFVKKVKLKIVNKV